MRVTGSALAVREIDNVASSPSAALLPAAHEPWDGKRLNGGSRTDSIVITSGQFDKSIGVLTDRAGRHTAALASGPFFRFWVIFWEFYFVHGSHSSVGGSLPGLVRMVALPISGPSRLLLKSVATQVWWPLFLDRLPSGESSKYKYSLSQSPLRRAIF